MALDDPRYGIPEERPEPVPPTDHVRHLPAAFCDGVDQGVKIHKGAITPRRVVAQRLDQPKER